MTPGAWLVVACAYLLGSVSFPALIARRAGVDLRRAGSRKLGGSNLAATVGFRAGAAGGLLDAAKGAAAVLGTRAAGLPEEAALLAGLAALAGQMWPAFHSFDGGRGNATGWAALAAVDVLAAVVAAVPLAGAVLLRFLVRPRPTRLLPLAAVLTILVWTAALFETDGATAQVGFGLAVFVLVMVRRLTAGLREDLRAGAPLAPTLADRLLYDRSALQRRGDVPL